MTDRETLIALIQHEVVPYFAERIADHLIANGVTIQRWIPVEERLPAPFVSVLVHMPLEEPMPTVHEGFLVNEEKWYAAHFDREKDEITHWMPLPEPPEVSE